MPDRTTTTGGLAAGPRGPDLQPGLRNRRTRVAREAAEEGLDVEPAQGTEENPHPNVAKDATLGWGTRLPGPSARILPAEGSSL